jgi:hypothetical protein
MIVFHGTSNYAFPSIAEKGLLLNKYRHVNRKCACTSLEFKSAEVFALRKSSSDEFIAGKITGVVLEFKLQGEIKKDYEPVKDQNSIQEEHEIAVFVSKCLKLMAVWIHDKKWIRHPLGN